MKSFFSLCAAVGTLGLAASAAALSATDFDPAASFTETFNNAGGPVGKWELDPSNIAGASPATYISSTPSNIRPAVVTLNPVGSSSDGRVMMMGNPSSTNSTLFGLNYMRCVNSKADGTGEDFTLLKKYRTVSRIFLYSPTEATTRWQVGPYVFGGDLFRAAAFYNTTGTGGGPGFGHRGATVANGAIAGTSALATARWTLMSVMVDATDADPANHKLAICVDANGDGVLSETDPLEYKDMTLASSARPANTFGIFSVGDVNSDTVPLFVDTVQLHKPATAAVSEWSLY